MVNKIIQLVGVSRRWTFLNWPLQVSFNVRPRGPGRRINFFKPQHYSTKNKITKKTRIPQNDYFFDVKKGDYRPTISPKPFTQ